MHGKKKLRGYAFTSLRVRRLARLRTDVLGNNGGKRISWRKRCTTSDSLSNVTQRVTVYLCGGCGRRLLPRRCLASLLGVFLVLFGCFFSLLSRFWLRALGSLVVWLVGFWLVCVPAFWFVGHRVLVFVRRVRFWLAARSVVLVPCPPCGWCRVVSASSVSFLPSGGLAVGGRPVGRRVGVAPARVVRSSGVVLSFWVFGARRA